VSNRILKDLRTGEPKRPSRATLHHEIITLRHVLKTANRHGWLPYFPDISPPYKTSGKISHRAWFSPEEYKRLYEATRERAKKPLKERWRTECEDLHDYVLFVVNTGLRPDDPKDSRWPSAWYVPVRPNRWPTVCGSAAARPKLCFHPSLNKVSPHRSTPVARRAVQEQHALRRRRVSRASECPGGDE
jgi:hypothetical protein